ncbi:MAG: NfeD family protein [Thermotogae bacterium]|nr:NfeD family protein [Thermotogota bacterium]
MFSWGREVWSLLFLGIGAFFIASELGLPTNFELFAIGSGFLSLSVMTYFGVPWPIQVVVFIVVVATIIAIAYRFSNRDEGPPPTAFTPLSLKGRRGRVVAKTEDGAYIVKVDGEEWRAESDEPLSVGDEVVVIDVVGVRLKVIKRR